MDAPQAQPSPQQAREQLAVAQSRSLSSGRDRRIHAIGTAVFGLAVGFLAASRNITDGSSWIWATLAYFALAVGSGIWVERAARTVPRRARLWSRVGVVTSLVLALVVVLPWLNLSAQTAPNTWSMVLVGGLGAATPSLVAAAVIAARRS
ncbi:MAG: hypothetical protein Q4P32_12785 [Micrococcales bacterium]|nr:hypothetical protein [Micrococcales bacterium]